MKRIITFLLIPLTLILIIFKKTYDLVEELASDIGYAIDNALESNYEFWKKIFKW